MEETIQKNTNPDNSNYNTSKESDDGIRDPGRREFLKGMGLVLGGALLAGCAPNLTKSNEQRDPFKVRVEKLNGQFSKRKAEFVNPDGSFNYGIFSQYSPEFNQYIEAIDAYSVHAQMVYGIEANAIKALSSSIIASNIGNIDGIDSSKEILKQRAGIMQFYPENVLSVYHQRINKHFNPSIENMNVPNNNINYGIIYLCEGLKDISDPNDNLMELMLAQYFGGGGLVGVVQRDQNPRNDNYLYSNYERYMRAKLILSGEGKDSKDSTEMDVIWNRALQQWPDSKLANNKEVFFQEASRYFEDQGNNRIGLTREQYLSLFISIAITESHGGLYTRNENSGALGWYQLIPKWRHLEDYNDLHGTNYTYQDIVSNDPVSIKVGVWTLMRYRSYKDIKELMMMFKGGNNFGYNQDDYQWWNSVSNNMTALLGSDSLSLGRY
jgi:hypothetical protein